MIKPIRKSVFLNKITFKADKDVLWKEYSFYQMNSLQFVEYDAEYLDHGKEIRSCVRRSIKENDRIKSKAFIMTNKTFDAKDYEKKAGVSLKKLEHYEVPDFILLQLLLNSLPNPNDKEYAYNNLTGHLYCYNQDVYTSNASSIVALEIYVSSDYKIHLQAINMMMKSKEEYLKWKKKEVAKDKKEDEKTKKDKPLYIKTYKNKGLKRVTKEEFDNLPEDTILYYFEGFKNHKCHLNVFAVEHDNEEKTAAFEKSKVGRYYHILKSLKKEYPMVSVDHIEVPSNTYCPKSVSSINKTDTTMIDTIYAYIEKYGLHFVNSIDKNFDMEPYIVLFRNVLTDEIHPEICKNFTQSAALEKGKLNIRFIHDKKYYEESKTEDVHIDTSEYVVQHMAIDQYCFEEGSEKSDDKKKKNIPQKECILNVLYNCAIKMDITLGKLNCFTWDLPGEWKFVYCFRHPNSKKEATYNFCRMTIENGNISFDKIINDYDIDNEYYNYLDIFSNVSAYQAAKMTVEHNGNVNYIKLSEMYMLPNVLLLGDRVIDKQNENQVMTSDNLVDLLLECQGEDYYDQIPEGEYSNLEIRALLKTLGIKVKRDFYSRAEEKYGVVMAGQYRGQKRWDYFGGMIDINFCSVDDNTYYSVGEISAGMKNKKATFAKLYEVQNLSGEIMEKEIVYMINNLAARYNKLTVLPFPAKYIREFAEMYGEN